MATPPTRQPGPTTGSSVLKALEGILGILFQTDALTADSFLEIKGQFEALIANVLEIQKRFRAFKFDPHWKTRVINAPKVVGRLKQLLTHLTTGVRADFDKLIQPFRDFESELVAARELAKEFDPAESRLLRGYQEIQQFINSLNQLVKDILVALEAIGDLEDLATQLLNDVETLDDLFLQQGNTRKVTEGKATIRVGKLHKS